jgi:hypothetical protein
MQSYLLGRLRLGRLWFQAILGKKKKKKGCKITFQWKKSRGEWLRVWYRFVYTTGMAGSLK